LTACKRNRSSVITVSKKIADQRRAIADLRIRYPIVGGTAPVRKKNGLLLLKAIAKLRGGTCLSSSFTTVLGQHYRLRCARGHEWAADVRNLFKGSWCAVCVHMSRRLTIEDMQVLAWKRDGQCLSSEYVNANTHLQWQCAAGHQWPATPANIRSGKWCPKCRGYMPADEQLALFAQLAQERGGQLLSTVYRGSHEPLQWRCAEGHTWMAVPGAVKGLNSWCPKCRGRYPKDEMLAQYRQIAIERGGQLVSTQFVSTQHKLTWRCGSGHTWEAQPSNIKIGTWCPRCFGHGTNDEHHETLAQLAVERGGRLLSDRYLGPRNKLTWECHLGHQWQATLKSVKTNGRWCPQCRVIDANAPSLMQKYHAIAQEHGGKCLSTKYMTAHQKMQWQCAQGHTWLASPSNIVGGKWCPRCSGRMPKAEHHAVLSQLARDRGGQLLSEQFVSVGNKLTWLCHRGHVWQAVPSSVKKGTWCPQCAILAMCGPKAARKYLAPTDKRDDLVKSSSQAGKRQDVAKRK
jgi:hypothetical protein